MLSDFTDDSVSSNTTEGFTKRLKLVGYCVPRCCSKVITSVFQLKTSSIKGIFYISQKSLMLEYIYNTPFHRFARWFHKLKKGDAASYDPLGSPVGNGEEWVI